MAVINGATVKGDRDYPNGILTLSELKAELPFPTKMVTVRIPGSVLQAALAFSRTDGPDGKERRGYLQVGRSVGRSVGV